MQEPRPISGGKNVGRIHACKSCGTYEKYRASALCRGCYNEKERKARAARMADPEYKAKALARQRERDRRRYAEDPAYKARKQAASTRRRLFYGQGSLTEAEWIVLSQMYRGLCAYCPTPAEVVDHVDPLAGGGAHTAANVVPACAACNLSKGDRLLIEWGGR